MFLATSHIEEIKSMTDMHFPASKGTIMVADDDIGIVNIVKTILEIEGYVVQTAYNGLEVFFRLEEQKPDLIILDIMMPGMDGFQVLKRLKERPETPSIPVALMTAKIQQEDVLTGYKMGADYYITKPFTNAHLINVTNFLLSKDKNTQTKSISSLRLAKP